MSRRRWVSLAPQGLGHQKPFHYGEMMRVAWQNRDALPFAWRILRDGVCDGCALGTSGLRDWTIPGVHLCMVRLELLRLNTAPALDLRRLDDAAALSRLTSAELRELGRLPEPLLRRRGDRGFTAIAWDEAIDLIARRLQRTDPQRVACYLTSRGITNEVYYVAQKAARVIGSNHVDNSARLCHAASTAAMKSTLGHGASTCSYVDWLGADLIVFFGANTPNNQPVTTKYLHEATRRGARIAVVNTFREPGLARYWVPSIASSAMFGTRLADEWFDVHTGGDLAFLIGVMKALIELPEGIDDAFVRERTRGFEAARDAARHADWQALADESGASIDDMRRFARLLIDRPNAIFVWSMGLTQHAHGVQTVQALVNVGLARGLLGRPHRGLMPIRGHSGVQGGAEVGCVPNVDAATRVAWTEAWGFELPAHHGWTAAEMVDASARGDVDVWWQVGGNFLETLADLAHNREALARPALRVHQDIVMSSAMLVEPADTVLILPAATRYESPGGGTETSTERRIIFSPEIPGRRVGSARAEWEVFRDVVSRAWPARARFLAFPDAASIRAEIARAVPLYAGIERLASKGDQVQWGGRTLFADGRFATVDGFAHFSTVLPLGRAAAKSDRFYVSTRRGKQFNSMVQREIDPLTGAARDAVLISEIDATRLKLKAGDAIELRSPHGTFTGRVQLAPMRPGNLEVHWPEGTVLLSGTKRDPASLEPDYNVEVDVRPLGSTGAASANRATSATASSASSVLLAIVLSLASLLSPCQLGPATPVRAQTQSAAEPQSVQRDDVHTLRDLLAAEKIDGTGLTPAALDRRITSYGVENDARYFTTGYFLDNGGSAIPNTLHVSVLDKRLKTWQDGTIKARAERTDFGSVLDIRHVGTLLYIEMHLNPSSSHTLVLTPRLERVTSFYGWALGTLPDGSVLYHNSQRHFAPTHQFALSVFDARTRRGHTVYPLKPYQPLRLAYIEKVRGVYEAETRRDPDWDRIQNHHGDPELFDSSFREPLIVARGTRKFAFIVRFGSAHVRPPTPEEDILVTCDLTRPAAADRCHEMRKADYQKEHPTFTDEALLKAILRE